MINKWKSTFLKRRKWWCIFACEVMAITSVILPVLHAIPDLGVIQSQLTHSPLSLSYETVFSYWIAGVVMEPILMISFSVFGLYFFLEERETHQKIGRFIGGVCVLYILGRIFWAYSTLNYFNIISQHLNTSQLDVLLIPGMLKGISALIGGFFAIMLTVFLYKYFSVLKDGYSFFGRLGALIILISTLTAIVVKTLAMWYFPYAFTILFIIALAIKSIGINFIGIALRHETP